MKKQFPKAKLLTCLSVGLVQSLSADISVDFNTASDLTANFNGYSDFAEQANGGLGDSGAVALSANSQVAVYQTPVTLSGGTDHVLSMYFQYNGGDGDGGTGRGFFVGFTSGAGDTYESSATTTGVDIRAIVAGAGSENLYGIDLQNDGANVDGSSKNIPLVIGNWYYLELTIMEIAPGEFQGVTVALYSSDAEGTVGDQLKILDNGGSGGYSVTSTLADAAEVYPFFGGQNPLSRAASTADHFTYTTAIPQPETEILRGTPLEIDGLLDGAWDAHPANELTIDIDGTAPEPADLSGYWKAMWDDEYLYFLLVTEDDTVVTWPGSQFWNYDMTELFLDMDYSRNDDVVRYDENDFQTVFPRDGQAAYANGSSPLSFPLHYAQTTEGTTTIVEVALPWDELTVFPMHGMPIGVDVYMKDNDTGEAARDGQISWSPSNDAAWKNPSLFGTAILLDEPATPETEILTGTPEAVDGIIEAKWELIPANPLTVDIDGTSPEATDLSGYWKAMWDEENLYFLLVTEDDAVVAWPGNQFWNYDMTELFLDMDYSRNDDVVRYDENDFQTVFPRDGQDAYANGSSPLSFPLDYVQVTEGTTTIVEVALPWSELTVTPEAGMPIGVDVYMKDNDTGEASRDGQISWSPSMDTAWKHPALFGTAVLSPRAIPSTEIHYGMPAALDGVIDGSWSAVAANLLTVDIDGTAPETADLSGYWKALWDNEYLYFLIVTEDDTVVTWPGSQFWNYDMTELFLDMDYSRNDDVERYDENDFQLYFPRDGQDAQNNGPAPVSLPLNYRQLTDGSTTVIELALPWSELTVSPSHGMPIGVDVYMKDNDTGEAARDAQIAWSPSRDEAWKHPALFGSAVLNAYPATPVTEVPAGTPEAIDGTIEAGWDAAPMNVLSVDIDGTMPWATNLSGYWKAMWDDSNLYLLLVSEDDTIVTWPGSQFWNYDMTELFLDMDYSRNDDVERYDDNDFQTVFPRDGQDAYANGPSPLSFPLNYAQVTDGSTTVVEVALPWAELTVTPVAGMPVGIDVYMKDNDTGEASRDNQIAWSPSKDQAWKHPALFGTGLLVTADHPMAFIAMTGAMPYPDGHYWSPWFGSFTPMGDWSHQEHLGWLYTSFATSADSFYLWSQAIGSWTWSTGDAFPVSYDYSGNRWVYYMVVPGTGTVLFDYSTGEWIVLN